MFELREIKMGKGGNDPDFDPIEEIESEVEILSSEEIRSVIDFDIDLSQIPEVWKPFIRCHHHQREVLEKLMRKNGWHYDKLVLFCCKKVKRNIKDIGEMSRGEAQEVIESLGGVWKLEI